MFLCLGWQITCFKLTRTLQGEASHTIFPPSIVFRTELEFKRCNIRYDTKQILTSIFSPWKRSILSVAELLHVL